MPFQCESTMRRWSCSTIHLICRRACIKTADGAIHWKTCRYRTTFFQKIPNCVSPHWTESTWRPSLSCIEIVLLKSELIEEAHEKCRRQAEDE